MAGRIPQFRAHNGLGALIKHALHRDDDQLGLWSIIDLLAKAPRETPIIEIIAAFEGPVALTECSTDVTGLCQIESGCPIKTNQRIINQAVRGLLGTISLADLIAPLQLTAIKDARGNPVPLIPSGRIQ